MSALRDRAPRDPLLAVVRLILAVAMAGAAFLAGVIALAAPALLIWRDRMTIQMSEQGVPPEAIWAVAGAVLLVAAMFALGFLFLRNLYRIVDSVGAGDPFVPVNASRLRDMGWLSVAIHGLTLPIAAIGHWAESLSPKVHADIDIPLSGLFLALVLFVLARVFREGTRLRDDLEGTV